MSLPPYALKVLAWRRQQPNIADADSATSVAIATNMFEQLGITARTRLPGQTFGARFEEVVLRLVREELPKLAPNRPWLVERGRLVVDFAQYDHLGRLEQLVLDDQSGLLSVEIGRDYLVRPDVTVGLSGRAGPLGDSPLLHAAISCKLTIRSDRIQNIRHEAVSLTRHRRGRQPHIVAVTAEPLPTRLAALARGTGDIDAVFHLALDELVTATEAAGNPEQRRVLGELIDQRRLHRLVELPSVLAE